MRRLEIGVLVKQIFLKTKISWNCALESGADLCVNESQELSKYRVSLAEEEGEKSIFRQPTDIVLKTYTDLECFDRAKVTLTSSDVLIHYNPSLPIKMAGDESLGSHTRKGYHH